VLPRQICCGPFTNLTKNFLIPSYLLNRPASWPRMRLTVLTLTAGSVLPKIYGSLNLLALVFVRFDHVASFIVSANHRIM
jgi:hypothetical protein